MDKTGFDFTNGTYEVTLSYNSGTREVTLTPIGASFDVWVQGKKFTYTGAQNLGAHTATQGGHFFYHDNAGFVISTTPWNLESHAPVAFCYYSTVAGSGTCYHELHKNTRSISLHRHLHSSFGTQVNSGGVPNGYTEDVTNSDAALKLGISECTISDEDIRHVLPALSSGGSSYTIWNRSGAGGDWTFTTGNAFPFLTGATPRVQYNLDTAGTWSMSEATSGNFVNYYVWATPSIATNQQFILIPSQAQFANEALATAESVSALDYGTFPFQEAAAIAKITIQTQNSYTSTPNAAIRAVQVLRGSTVTVNAGSAPADHGSLLDLLADDHTQYQLTCASQSVINTTPYTFSGTETRNGGYLVDTTA